MEILETAIIFGAGFVVGRYLYPRRPPTQPQAPQSSFRGSMACLRGCVQQCSASSRVAPAVQPAPVFQTGYEAGFQTALDAYRRNQCEGAEVTLPAGDEEFVRGTHEGWAEAHRRGCAA